MNKAMANEFLFTIFGGLYQGRKSQDGCDSWKFVLVGPIFKFSMETGGKKGENFAVVTLEFPEFLGDQRNPKHTSCTVG